jgi:choline dehydrogenase-like flavoprotein
MNERKWYDVVIVGGGMSGAVLAKQLGNAGKNVLVLEAGKATGTTQEGYQTYMDTFFNAVAKIPNSPYPPNPNAPSPTVLEIQQIQGLTPDTSGYFVQNGPLPFGSTYTRAQGGTMLHWLGTCLRMLPNDFKLRSLYQRGRDWPITYEELRPYYRQAEFEIGVAADVEDQEYLGITFEEGYVYPMYKIPQSYWDKLLCKNLAGMHVEFDSRRYPIKVVSTPQGRNSVPNPNYNNGKGFTPVGAVGDPDIGQRCEGNSNCTPICPVQAKYNANKTLATVNKENVEIITKAVASQIEIDADSGRVAGITYKRYEDENSPEYTTHTAKGTIYVLAAHAVENAKLLLASNAARSSGLVGRNLMDHPTMLTWGLMTQNIGSFRGPGSTSGIPTLRDGEFRKERAAFRVEIGNWGWSWPATSPYDPFVELVDESNLFGTQLRETVSNSFTRQFRFGFLIEQLPQTTNRVTIDPTYKDQLGNYRPVINYNVSDYTRAGMAAAKQVSDLIFERLGVQAFTEYNPSDPGYVTFENQGYVYNGAGHLAGTHVMGDCQNTSVIDANQRCWDHENLYLVGCGNFPTISTSNPTLTMVALTFWAAENILKELR